MEGLGRIINSWKQLTSPHISGVKNLPDPIEAVGRPVLFVGNHTSLGMYDLPLLVSASNSPEHVWNKFGIAERAIGVAEGTIGIDCNLV
jgi:1-acyl-sn-glycerol-3-phosphate acyltransferase